jgi:hypothetical protein
LTLGQSRTANYRPAHLLQNRSAVARHTSRKLAGASSSARLAAPASWENQSWATVGRSALNPVHIAILAATIPSDQVGSKQWQGFLGTVHAAPRWDARLATSSHHRYAKRVTDITMTRPPRGSDRRLIRLEPRESSGFRCNESHDGGRLTRETKVVVNLIGIKKARPKGIQSDGLVWRFIRPKNQRQSRHISHPI